MDAVTYFTSLASDAYAALDRLSSDAEAAAARHGDLERLSHTVSKMFADGRFTEDEMDVIRGRVARLGLDGSAIEAAYREALKDSSGVVRAEHGQQLQSALLDIVDGALRDSSPATDDTSFRLQVELARLSSAIQGVTTIRKATHDTYMNAIGNLK